MNIYISGSISKNPNYKEQFAAAESKLKAAGHSVINPARNTGNSYKEYIDKGLEQEMQCEAIYMLPGYEESTGAMLELQYAKAVEMKIMFEQEGKTMEKATFTINISVEEYTRLKDIETRFEILKNQAMNDDFCAKHTQIVLGIEHSYEAKQAKKELNADMFPVK